MLLLVLSPAGYTQLHRSHSLGVIYKFDKRYAVPQVKLGIDSRANIFGASYEADALQNNRLKKDLSISVSFMTLYAVKLQSECRDESSPNLAIRYIIFLSGKTNTFLNITCHLPYLSIPTSRCVP